jgi:hypothetical protein
MYAVPKYKTSTCNQCLNLPLTECSLQDRSYVCRACTISDRHCRRRQHRGSFLWENFQRLRWSSTTAVLDVSFFAGSGWYLRPIKPPHLKLNARVKRVHSRNFKQKSTMKHARLRAVGCHLFIMLLVMRRSTASAGLQWPPTVLT